MRVLTGIAFAIALGFAAAAQTAPETEPVPAETPEAAPAAEGTDAAARIAGYCRETDAKPASCDCQGRAIAAGVEPRLIEVLLAVSAARTASKGQPADAQEKALRDGLATIGLKPDNLGELQQAMLRVKDEIDACRAAP